MTGRTSNAATRPHVEFRVMLPADAAEDLKQMAKVSGLAASQYLRSLYLTHRAKMYAPKDND